MWKSTMVRSRDPSQDTQENQKQQKIYSLLLVWENTAIRSRHCSRGVQNIPSNRKYINRVL